MHARDAMLKSGRLTWQLLCETITSTPNPSIADCSALVRGACSFAAIRGHQMHFYPNERLALFIDGANLYATAKALGFDIDYKRLLALFRTQGPAGARPLLHGAGRGSGILLDPAAGRLARLQRLHDGDQADQGIHRLRRAPQDQRQHGHRADRRCHGAGRDPRPCRAVLRRRRFPRLVEALQQRACASAWSRRCRRSRRWSPTNCAGRPTSSSTWPTSKTRSAAIRPRAPCASRVSPARAACDAARSAPAASTLDYPDDEDDGRS